MAANIELDRVSIVTEDLTHRKEKLMQIVSECQKKMTELQTVYESDASREFVSSLDKIATEIDDSVTAIINSLNTNAERMATDYKAQDRKNAESLIASN